MTNFPGVQRVLFELGCFQESNNVSFLVNEWRISLGAKEIQHHFLGQRGCYSNKLLTRITGILSCPFFTLVQACGSLRIIFHITLKVNERETGKCWGSGAMLDIFGPYSSTGRPASELPFQLLSPPVVFFSPSPSFGVCMSFHWWFHWWPVMDCLGSSLKMSHLHQTASGRWWWSTPWLWLWLLLWASEGEELLSPLIYWNTNIKRHASKQSSSIVVAT